MIKKLLIASLLLLPGEAIAYDYSDVISAYNAAGTSLCSAGYYGEGEITGSSGVAITDDPRCYPFVTTCTGTPSAIRGYTRYAATPDDSVILFAYGDSGGSGPDTSNLLFVSAETAGGAPGWTPDVAITSAEIPIGTTVWLCMYDEAGAQMYSQPGTTPSYMIENAAVYPDVPETGSYTASNNLLFLIQLVY